MIKPGKNIAMKVPTFKWAETVRFYRDKVGLPQTHSSDESVAFAFGEMTLWIDCAHTQSQTDIWLELFTPTPNETLKHLGSLIGANSNILKTAMANGLRTQRA